MYNSTPVMESNSDIPERSITILWANEANANSFPKSQFNFIVESRDESTFRTLFSTIGYFESSIFDNWVFQNSEENS